MRQSNTALDWLGHKLARVLLRETPGQEDFIPSDPDALRRTLRPGGTFVASVPNAFRLKNRLRFLLGRKPEDDPTHLHMFSPAEVRALLAGFEDVRLDFIAGRLVPLHARLLANDIVFSGRKPR